jgi:hypothetical protein
VGQYKTTKKKSPETTNNRPARGSSGGSTHLPTQGSSGGAACHCGSGSHREHPPPGVGQLWGRRVSLWLWFPPPNSGQLRGHARHLRGHRVSPRLRFPPPGSGQLRGCCVSPRLRFPPPGSGQLRGPEPARVSWAPAPASQRRAAPGRMKTVEPSSS